MRCILLYNEFSSQNVMHRSAKFQAPRKAVDFLFDLVKVFLLCYLGQIVT